MNWDTARWVLAGLFAVPFVLFASMQLVWAFGKAVTGQWHTPPIWWFCPALAAGAALIAPGPPRARLVVFGYMAAVSIGPSLLAVLIRAVIDPILRRGRPQ